MQMRGLGANYRPFTAHRDDIACYDALPRWKGWPFRTFETWLRKQYGDVIYTRGRYAR